MNGDVELDVCLSRKRWRHEKPETHTVADAGRDRKVELMGQAAGPRPGAHAAGLCPDLSSATTHWTDGSDWEMERYPNAFVRFLRGQLDTSRIVFADLGLCAEERRPHLWHDAGYGRHRGEILGNVVIITSQDNVSDSVQTFGR